ncbi:uncharacterized protein LOC141649279 [Silene latifolia]|uniref:uncharacterized protein LOC141649279 n=1 Tax=Silene latifolia TaxID=37657 RepID=UPI003D780956
MLGTKKLSYAGRLVLIKAMYKTLHSYWASIFIIPKAVLTKIEAICRNFLWDRGTKYTRTPTVAWAKICTDQKRGGLGLRMDSIWNKAAIGKLEDYTPPNEASWTWKKVCKIRKELQEAYDQNEWTCVLGKEYTIKKGYNWLSPVIPEVEWHHLIWTKWSIPKHSFIAWLYYHQGFNTKGKLYMLGISPDSTCCICAQEEETSQHLFFQCQYNRKVIQCLQAWTGVQFSTDNIQNWRQHRRFTRLKTGTLNSIINSSMYHIWMQRNGSRHEFKLISPSRCAAMIQGDIRARIQQQARGIMSRKYRQWLEKLM